MRYNNFMTIIFNEIYNFFFILINNIKYFKEKDKNEYHTLNKNIKHAYNLQNVWLLNLKRLINDVKKKNNLEDLFFLDVGCGNGIPIYYAAKNFNFKFYYGIDFEKNNVIKSRINTKNFKKKTVIKHLDASNLFLKNNRYFIFMYNPFDIHIFKNFFFNNKKIIKKNKCIIGYINIENDKLFRFLKPRSIKEYKKYKSKLFYF